MTVTRQADLKVTKTASPSPATAGTNEAYTVTVQNLGPSDSAGYSVKDILASGTTYVSSTGGCANASGTVTCTSSALVAGGTDTFTITVHIGSDYTDVSSNKYKHLAEIYHHKP